MDVLRRVEAGERLRVTVDRRPVAELGPLDRPRWASGAAIERALQEASADATLLEDVAAIRGQVIEPRVTLSRSSTRDRDDGVGRG